VTRLKLAQASRAAVMAVRASFRDPERQAHLRHDAGHQLLVLQNAAVEEQRVLASLRVVDNPPSRNFVVLDVGGHRAYPPQVFPIPVVVMGVDFEMRIALGLGYRRAVDEDPALVDEDDPDLRDTRLLGGAASLRFRADFFQKASLVFPA
jgi:hypothetical protein